MAVDKIGLIGYGYLGRAYGDFFPEAKIYDPFSEDIPDGREATREDINGCDIAVVAVPTDPLASGELDMSIVEDTVRWCEASHILIKSALMPGTVDRLVEETGKNIAVSLEYIGMGNYYLDPSQYPDPLDPKKHKLLVIGGEVDTAEFCAGVLWSKMSPATRIHLMTAKEVEICKLIENAYGALKVTWANCFYNLVKKSGQSVIRTHQAWSEDGRTDPMHTRVVEGKRGWASHCYDKDIKALQVYANSVGAYDMADLYKLVMDINEGHLRQNEDNKD